MSDLPRGWRSFRVGDFFHSFSGGTPNKSVAQYWNGNIPWVSSGEFVSDVIRDGTKNITRQGLEESSAKMCRPGSVIVVVRSGILKHSLPVAIVGQPLTINQDIKCFDSGDDELNRWLFLGLKTFAKEILSLNREGTTVQSVKYDTLKEFRLPLPPLTEQRRIVAKLEELLGRVDAVKERLATIPRILKQFRQSVLAAACSGRLTADWRKDNTQKVSVKSSIESVSERRLSTAGTPSKQEQLQQILGSHEEGDSDELPVGWTYVALEKLCDSFDYGTSTKSQPSGKVPVLRMGNIQRGEIDWSDLVYTSSEREISKYNLAPNTVLFNRTNSPELVGKTAIYRGERQAIFAGYLIRINNLNVLDSEYLNYCLNSSYAREYCLGVKSDGVSQSNINAQKLGKFEVPFCSLSEQREIVRRVAALFRKADALETRYLNAKNHVDRLNQTLLDRAFRGELVPQDPKDEPASALLDHIRRAKLNAPLPVKQKRMKKRMQKSIKKEISVESVKQLIESFPEDRFSFAELRSVAAVDYESLKKIVFEILGEPTPEFTQVFDKDSQAMRFERAKH